MHSSQINLTSMTEGAGESNMPLFEVRLVGHSLDTGYKGAFAEPNSSAHIWLCGGNRIHVDFGEDWSATIKTWTQTVCDDAPHPRPVDVLVKVGCDAGSIHLPDRHSELYYRWIAPSSFPLFVLTCDATTKVITGVPRSGHKVEIGTSVFNLRFNSDPTVIIDCDRSTEKCAYKTTALVAVGMGGSEEDNICEMTRFGYRWILPRNRTAADYVVPGEIVIRNSSVAEAGCINVEGPSSPSPTASTPTTTKATAFIKCDRCGLPLSTYKSGHRECLRCDMGKIAEPVLAELKAVRIQRAAERKALRDTRTAELYAPFKCGRCNAFGARALASYNPVLCVDCYLKNTRVHDTDALCALPTAEDARWRAKLEAPKSDQDDERRVLHKALWAPKPDAKCTACGYEGLMSHGNPALCFRCEAFRKSVKDDVARTSKAAIKCKACGSNAPPSDTDPTLCFACRVDQLRAEEFDRIMSTTTESQSLVSKDVTADELATSPHARRHRQGHYWRAASVGFIVLEMEVDDVSTRKQFIVIPGSTVHHNFEGLTFWACFTEDCVATLSVIGTVDGWSPGPARVAYPGVDLDKARLRKGSSVKFGCHWHPVDATTEAAYWKEYETLSSEPPPPLAPPPKHSKQCLRGSDDGSGSVGSSSDHSGSESD